MGGAIRDSGGSVLACWSLQMAGYFDVVTSQLLAIREGFVWQLSSGVHWLLLSLILL